MKLTLKDVRHESPDALSFIFRPEERVSWQAGQFLLYSLPGPAGDFGERYFSIASAPQEKVIVLTTRIHERSSEYKKMLKEMPVGEIIEAKGPEGDFVISDPTEEMIFIAGGVGITAIRSILKDLDYRNLPIHATLLYANHDSNFIFRDDLDELQRKHEAFTVRYFLSPERITLDAIRERVADIARPTFFISGPESMVEAFDHDLGSAGVSPHRRRTDFLPGYEWTEGGLVKAGV